jgi:hypothetical protein
MFEYFKNMFAAKVSPPSVQVVGKLSSEQQSPSALRIDPSTVLGRADRNYHTRNLDDYRYANDADTMLMLLSKIDPDMSTGIWNFMRLANSGLRVTAVDLKNVPSPKGQEMLNAMCTRIAGLDNYKDWALYKPVELVASQLIKYVLIRGGCALETVLGKDKRVNSLCCIDPLKVSFVHTGVGVYVPQQTNLDGVAINLNIPTFFWNVLDQDADDPYETPPFLPAVSAILFNIAFMQDLERIVKKMAYPRLTIKIVESTLRKFAPLIAQSDETKMAEWLQQQKSAIGTALRTLAPEDAAVFFDSIEINVLESKHNATVDFRPLKEVIDQRIISGLKSMPTILGRQFGSSQTIGGVEALLYSKSIASIQEVVSALLTRALTLALRLEGHQGYVKVSYAPVNLKPENELETFRVLKQSRTLELLSLGFISDAEAAKELTGDPTLPPGFKKLSGTGFYDAKANVNTTALATDASRNPTQADAAGGGRNKTAAGTANA